MPDTNNNLKRQFYQLIQLMMQETDEDHKLSAQEILSLLKAAGTSIDRRTLYSDFIEMDKLEFDLIKEGKNRFMRYYIGSRTFELPELKLLVDAVQSSRFITEKKSSELIKKLETLTSRHLATRLQRQVVTSGRIKSMNKSIYYNVDAIHDAIAEDRQIQFHYFQWDSRKQRSLRNNGEFFVISPWAMIWQDDNYYMLGYDAAPGKLKHYRVDKMLDITVTNDSREGRDAYDQVDMGRYGNSLFGMFGGETVRVTINMDPWAVGVLIDRFGTEIPLVEQSDGTISTAVDVIPSIQFFGWVFGLDGGVRITGPATVVEKMQRAVQRQAGIYNTVESEAGK